MAEEEKRDQEKESSDALRKAVIGLIGTLLTVCGGLVGALLTAGITVYQVEREAQQVALAASGGDQALAVDTRQIKIDRNEAARLALSDYAVDMDLEFVMAQPRKGWGPIEEMAYYDLVFEETAASPLVYFFRLVDDAWDEQPVRRIRHTEAIEIQYLEDSTENDLPVAVETLRSLIGSDTLVHHSQITVLAVDKQASADVTLPTIALTWGPDPLSGGGVNRLVSNRESQYILMQATSQLKNVRVNGQETDLSIERWALFAEGAQHYYVVELNYVPALDQSLQTWEDLQAYLDGFRIMQ